VRRTLRRWFSIFFAAVFALGLCIAFLPGATDAISIALLEFREADSSPQVYDVKTVIVPNGTLTDDGVVGGKPQVTLDFSAGGVVPAGSDREIQFNDGGTALGSETDIVVLNTPLRIRVGPTTGESCQLGGGDNGSHANCMNSSGVVTMAMGQDSTGGNPYLKANSPDQLWLWNTGVGTVDISDAVFLGSAALPNGAAPTIDAAGEIAIDTTDAGVATGQLVYHDGDAARVLSDVLTVSRTIESLTDTDDGKPFWVQSAYTDVTILSAACVCVGTCTTGATLTFDSDDGTPAALTGTVTCRVPGSVANDALSGVETNLDQFEVLLLNVSNTPNPLTDDYSITVHYRAVIQ